MSTKLWFTRVSWPNKKKYLLVLLKDLRSAWALSLVLKCIWNCRPKDAVHSASSNPVWSTYDQAPLDHNRTAQPVSSLAQTMRNDRLWFLSLDPESQAIVLSELLIIAGGPAIWEVWETALGIYEKYREDMLQNIKECIVVNDSPRVPQRPSQPAENKKDTTQQRPKTSGPLPSVNPPGQAQKELEENLAVWNTTIKTIRDSMKLEEVEIKYMDGTKQKIWKVNRPKPEVVETVGFIQLLPSAIGKMILSYLPRAQLGDYARVNKYWAYLVEEFKAELIARQKINGDLKKLQELMLRYDTSMELLAQTEVRVGAPSSIASAATSTRQKQLLSSTRASVKSAGGYSFKHMLHKKKHKSVVAQKPFRNLAELKNRLDQRGAADENLSVWCENIIKQAKSSDKTRKSNMSDEEGVLQLPNLHFPCPLMKMKLDVPLETPLFEDPSILKNTIPKNKISNLTIMNIPKPQNVSKYKLWTKDISKFYPVVKIPSHQSPF